MGTFTPRSLDIDVVMDLMVHEIDVISALVSSEVAKIDAVGIPILTRKVDLANARIQFADGCVANITASRVAGERLRKLRVFQPNEYYSLDYADQQVAAHRLVLPTTPQGRAEIVFESLEVIRREPLLAEIEAFVTAVRGHVPVVVTGMDGRRALEIALEVVRKIEEHAGSR
jgi:predicted dehydrogenase